MLGDGGHFKEQKVTLPHISRSLALI